MKYKYFIGVLPSILLFFLILSLKHPAIFNYTFKQSLIPLYQRSQDIPHEVKDRIFLSDSDIHIASGYLYANGNDPTTYNFQHPPFIKYLFGFSTRIFQTPFIIQIIFGVLYLILSYYFAWKISKNIYIASITSLLLSIDPVFQDVASQALLDLGQSVLALSFVLSSLFSPGALIMQGILFGLFAASKFWSTAFFFLIAIIVYKWLIIRKVEYLKLLKILFVAFITFSLVYAAAFITHKGAFNIIFFQLKILKYWFHQSLSSMPAASLLLFMTGYVKSWWGNRGWVWTTPWSILWPLSFVSALYMSLQKRTRKELTFAAILPIIFLVYLGAQAPFTRYFVIILPYLYVSLPYVVCIVFPNLIRNPVMKKIIKR